MIYASLIRDWAEARNLIGGSDPKSQFIKLMEEAGEVAAALRHWLWQNFGWDIYEWDDGDLRF